MAEFVDNAAMEEPDQEELPAAGDEDHGDLPSDEPEASSDGSGSVRR